MDGDVDDRALLLKALIRSMYALSSSELPAIDAAKRISILQEVNVLVLQHSCTTID